MPGLRMILQLERLLQGVFPAPESKSYCIFFNAIYRQEKNRLGLGTVLCLALG